MRTDSHYPDFERPDESQHETGGEQHVIKVLQREGHLGAVCLTDLLALLRHRTDELVPDFTIIETRRRLPPRAAEGVFFGASLRLGRLEAALGDLQVAVMDGEMMAEQAAQSAREEVLSAVLELRFGARLRRRVFVPATLPPIAELGRLCAIVRHLADELDTLGERCFGTRPTPPATTVRLRINSIEQ